MRTSWGLVGDGSGVVDRPRRNRRHFERAFWAANARASDIFSRYGGEEFLLVLPEMDEPTAVARAEQLRRTLAETPIIFGDSQIRVTASLGIATFPRDGHTSAELIGAADRALYAAKAAGRDRVVISV